MPTIDQPFSAHLRASLCAVALGLTALLAGCAGGPAFETLSARVVSESSTPLPENAVLEVQLEDETTGSVLASSRFEQIRTFPASVTLQYAPAAIVPDDLYRLSAQVRSDGRILYLSPEPTPVFGVDEPDSLDIVVEPTGAGAPPATQNPVPES